MKGRFNALDLHGVHTGDFFAAWFGRVESALEEYSKMKRCMVACAAAIIFIVNAAAAWANDLADKPVSGSGRSEHAAPLPDQAKVDDVWERIQALIELPHGLVTIDRVDLAFGGHLEYQSKDITGYTAGAKNFKNKNYRVSLIYLSQPADKKRLTGPESTLIVGLPMCLDLNRAEQDLLRHGMHLLATQSPPLPTARIYTYMDGNGSVELHYDIPYGRPSREVPNVCVKSMILRGFVKSL